MNLITPTMSFVKDHFGSFIDHFQSFKISRSLVTQSTSRIPTVKKEVETKTGQNFIVYDKRLF